jgi:hypothetical protein
MDVDTRVTADLTVVGGGVAGVCAAVSAARLGLETVLINDRPVLGGNASSEVRVWVNGATGGEHNRYAREGGLMEEILLENKARNPDGNADLWDMVLQDLVASEPNLSVYLNLLIDEMGTDGARVEWVGGTQNMSELTHRFESPYFVDATGDGVLAARTTDEWRQGREGQDEYGELAAPERSDDHTLGSSIMFYSEAAEESVEYTPPDFAKDFKDDPPEILAKRSDPNDRRCLYWWIEYGGDLDPIADNDEIRDELWAIVYGAWDYIKNSGAFPDEEVEHLQLEWTGKIPGKRESRRFLGEHVLTESDLVEQRQFDDVVGHGGWSIDLHPPSGIYDDQGRGAEQWHLPGPYQIPYRCLYPRESENLWVAGRHVSASHVAFGSLRVQMTLATLGQAVGTAAAVADRHESTPSGVLERIDELQGLLRREDQWVMGVPREDPNDLAQSATVRASSEWSVGREQGGEDMRIDLDDTYGLHLSAPERIDSIEFLLEADSETELTIEIHEESRPENYIPEDHVGERTVEVEAGHARWVEVPIDVATDDAQGVFLILDGEDDLYLHATEGTTTGVIASRRSMDEIEESEQIVDMVPAEHRYETYWPPTEWTPRLRVDPQPELFAPENVTDGFDRPYGLPHSWRSAPVSVREDGDGAVFEEDCWIELSWEDARTVTGLQLTFDTALTPWYNALTPMERPAAPEAVRDYRIEYHDGEDWETVETVEGNYQRKRRHCSDPIETDRVRVQIDATNGVPWAELFAIQVFGPEPDYPIADR